MESEKMPISAENPETTKKIQAYREMLRDSSAIFIFSAGTKQAGDNIEYRPDSYRDIDAHGLMSGGHARVIAAAEIGQYFPNVKLVATSRDEKNLPLAEIYAQELRHLGVPQEQIELETNSTSTLTELVEMVKMAKRQNWESVAILSSDYHKERIQAMLDNLEKLSERMNEADGEFVTAWEYFKEKGGLRVQFLQAEEILPLRDPRYAAIIDKVRRSELYKKRAEAEKKGVQQIIEGTYGKE